MPTDFTSIQSTLSVALAQELLTSTIPARLAFVSRDGTPRVSPIWFHWNGESVIFGTRAGSTKVRAIERDPNVAITIDSDSKPYKVLRLRGRAEITIVSGVLAEYAEAAYRYYGAKLGRQWLETLDQPGVKMARISVVPDWAELLDFRTLFPSMDWNEQ